MQDTNTDVVIGRYSYKARKLTDLLQSLREERKESTELSQH